MAISNKNNHKGSTSPKTSQRDTAVFKKDHSEIRNRTFPVQQRKPAGGSRPNQGNKKDG